MDIVANQESTQAQNITSSSHGLSEQQRNIQMRTGGNGPASARKLAPLLVNETTSIPAGDVLSVNSRSPKSPTAMKTMADSQNSPHSPRSALTGSPTQPGSPREMRLGTGSANIDILDGGNDEFSARKVKASPPKSHSYSQLRNVSSPLLQAIQPGNSSPPSPRSTTYPPPVGVLNRQEARPMPRTSSIDSAISNVSLSTVHSHRPSQDSASGQPDISNLIQAAGSAEAVIQHLIREKQHSAAQNAQLWKLVDKQRSLVLGLNQDLEKALRDKEKYRKKLKEHLDNVPPVPSSKPIVPVAQPVAHNHSPTPSEASTDLPIQGQNQEQTQRTDGTQRSDMYLQETQSIEREDASVSSGKVVDPRNDDVDRTRSKSKNQEQKHSHKATSSSDIGVFSPLRPAPIVTPIQTDGLDKSKQGEKLGSPSSISPSTKPVVSPTNSFTAKRSQPQSGKAFSSPGLLLMETIPPGSDVERMTPPRKAPPAPLDLGPTKRETPTQMEFGPEDHSGSDYDEDMEVDELPVFHRGRKKTREDDDKEREAALRKEQEDRSRSKMEKKSKSRTTSAKSISQDQPQASQQQTVPFTPSFKAFSPDAGTAGASTFLSPPTSLASVLNPSGAAGNSSTTERILSTKPMSPGLPLSPRPNHRPMNPPTPRLPREGTSQLAASPPVSPRNEIIGLPLSPRALRQPIPLPPYTPMSLASPRSKNTEEGPIENQDGPIKDSSISDHLQTDVDPPSYTFESSRSREVFTGFVSEAYPGLLLPPNALPSILIRVISSRLKPSRHSLVIKGSDEEPGFVLGIFARSNQQGLWQVEKPLQSLQQLDHHLRQSAAIAIKQPDRSLFSGHAPAKVDARRLALEKYFETLLDTQMDEKAALTLCRYLSTQVSEPTNVVSADTIEASKPGSPIIQTSSTRPVKEGYLTKRGKNFGGWKARFFILNDTVLRYYETPGGSLLGTIKLHSAQIGKQNNRSTHSPSRGEEADGSYRHAFLIREPKRKDSNSFMDHVLCAESDAERDAWVAALLCYVEVPAEVNTRPLLTKNESSSNNYVAPSKKNSLKKDVLSADSPDSDTFESLQAVPYENTQVARAPTVQITPDPRPTESPSPTTSGSQPSMRTSSAQSKAISGPQNGAKISDVGAWGNKPMASPLAHPREQKKRSIWGFRDRNAADLGSNHSNDSDLSLVQQQYQEQITNVKAAFGATLADAVSHCRPRGIEVCLPAVLYRCLEYLEMKNAAGEEGIFRMSGSNTLIKNLRSRFNAEGDIDLLGDEEPYYDVHAIASLLKLYLRELPQPVLTRELHLQFISVLDYPEKSDKITAYNALVHKLPKPNFTLLRALSSFLITIVNNQEVNKMSVRNVGIVFSPTLNIPAPVFSMFLTEFEAIFAEPPDNTAVPSLEVMTNEPLTPEDIRSPRRQMFSDIPTPSYTQETFSKNGFSSLHQPLSTPEQVSDSSRLNGETGFVPLQPVYSTPAPEHESISLPGPEYAVARPRNLEPGGLAKQRRRESSMLLM